MAGVSEKDSDCKENAAASKSNESENNIGDSVSQESKGDIEVVRMTSDGTEKNGGDEKGAGPSDEEGVEKDKEQEVVLIQDTGFNVKIVCPGVEEFELPVSSMELVQEIHQVLMDREDTCHRTCFSLQLEGQTLDNFAELKTIEGLAEGSVIKVVEEPYTIREARIHLRHIRDLLKSVDPADAYNGIDCNSLSFLNIITAGDILEKKVYKPDSMDCTPPEFIIPGAKERPLLPMHPSVADLKSPQCVKVLTLSGWNPPPGNRKLHGDLIYLYAVTLEDKKYHITASTRGFYVNMCTEDVFNPRAAAQKCLSHTLVELLNQLSPAFKRNFAQLLKKRGQKHPFERVPTPYQIYTWMVPQTDHTVDYIRAEDAFTTRLGYEEHIPGQTRDWNEEIQTTRELPHKTLPERLIRERAIFKVHSDFVAAASRGAQAVIDGNVMAINPGDEAKNQMYIWNNIFFSLGFDVRDHYKDFGGDYAAYNAPGNDLQGVRAYFNTDVEGMYTLGTVVVDYRGYRITAQSIIPGILEREQEQSVVYGSIDFGKTVVSNDKYKELLQKSATQLKIRPHKVLNEKGEEIELISSIECKGIVGNDQRHYVLDLLRTTPPDVNFLPTAYHFQQMQLNKKKAQEKGDVEPKIKDLAIDDVVVTGEKKDSIETDEAKKIVEALTGSENQTVEESSRDIVKKAALAVGSLSDTEFNITFNPDVYQAHVKHAQPESAMLRREEQIVKDAAEFLVLHQIPTLVNDCLDHSSSPIDGATLTETMHTRGINMRYLGKVTETFAKYKSVSYVYTICISELITRAAKHLYKTHMQGVDSRTVATAISHFLNCLLGSFPNPSPGVTVDEGKTKKKKRRNKQGIAVNIDNVDWVNETPRSLWRKIADEVEDYFHYTLECDSIDSAIEKYGVQRVSLLRAFCQRVGIQILLRDYNLDCRNRAVFNEDDLINVFPIVKHIQPRASDAYHFFTSGQAKIQQGLIKEGYDLIQEALNLLNNVYGAMHPEIAACLRLLARLNYIMGDYGEAMSYQQRAVLMSERVLGIDHPNTITEYSHLALYCFANNQVSSALRLMYRTRYLALLCHGENHPEIGLIDSNIGLILHAVEEYERYYGGRSLKVAMSYHLVARTHSCRGDFRAALASEKEAYTIYRQTLGEEHERTRESSECLKHLTQQAVTFQKKMNEIVKGEKVTSLAPLQIQTPSMQSVLEMLNVINGIVFVQISPEEIERIRREVGKNQEVKNKDAESKDSDSGNESNDGLSSPDKETAPVVNPAGMNIAVNVRVGFCSASVKLFACSCYMYNINHMMPLNVNISRSCVLVNSE
ncbi:CLU-like protein [Mya arenaria]|uniref:Clustered mitochondria protein homolog n=1 Tax=Mya arenaria TaxID=6604 RepID=A0ABY7E1V3_MYAAR|nr:CLU-like protein [Mya arenaria]